MKPDISKLKYEVVDNLSDHKNLFEMWSDACKELLENKDFDKLYNDAAFSSYGDAIVAYTPRNKPVGLILFYENNSKSLWISKSYVLPKYRKQGVYYRMRLQLTKYAKEKNYEAIFGGVYKHNVASTRAKLNYGDKIILQTFKETIR